MAGDRWQNQFLVRRLVLLLPLVLLAFGSAEAGGPAHNPGATATAWAIRVSPANASSAASPSITSPPAAAPSAGSFTFPSDGSIVRAASITASATTAVTTVAAAHAESVVTGLAIFNGEITADAVTARASAGTGPSGAGGNANGSGVSNLVVNGAPVSSGRVPLGDWGQLTISAQGIDRSAPEGALGYRGFVTVLDIHLTADHGGLPANSEIQVGYAEAAAQTAPPAAPAVTTTDTGTDMLAFVDRRVTVAAVLDACVRVTVQEPLAPGGRVRGEHASCASDDAAGDKATVKETAVCPT